MVYSRAAIFCLLSLLLVSCATPRWEPMTPARFQDVVTMPGDSLPLPKPLAALPFWSNAVVRVVMTYASGEVFREETGATAHKVGGRYVVAAMHSKYYQQTMYGVMEYDRKARAIKTYGLYGDAQGGVRIIEGTAVYDPRARTYTITSAYDDFKEITTGHYTDAEDVSKTLVYKNGALFMTREVETRPVGRAQ